MQFVVERAVRSKQKARIAGVGVAGSGKTMSFLRMACTMARLEEGRALCIDSEAGKSRMYGQAEVMDELLDFDCIVLQEFAPLQYVAALEYAAKLGYKAVVVDSLSHAWMGKGGALEMVDEIAMRSRSGSDSRTGWRTVSPQHNQLVDALVRAPYHLLVTMRAKTEYVTEKDDRGRTFQKKIGLQPVQREGLEFEFDVCGDFDLDTNTFMIGKTRLPFLKGKTFVKPGRELAEQIHGWLSSPDAAKSTAKAAPAPEAPPVVEKAEPVTARAEAHAAFIAMVGAASNVEEYTHCSQEYVGNKGLFSPTQLSDQMKALRVKHDELKAAQQAATTNGASA